MSAIFGSVANMLIYRLPRQLNIVTDRSRCPKCDHVLFVTDLIPIFSYLWLKGRCQYCYKVISSRYLYVELICVILAFYVTSLNLSSIDSVKLLIFAYITLILFFSDLETQLLPLILTLGLIILGVTFHIESMTILFSLTGAMVGFLIIWLIRLLTSVLYKTETMGFGDILLMAGVGAFWGIKTVVMVLHLAIVIGGIIAIVLLITKRAKKHEYIAFGPFIILGFWVDYFFGNSILSCLYG